MREILHNFSNQLVAIHSYSLQVLNRIEKSDPLRPDLECIKASSEKATQLARQLLYLAGK